MALYFIQQNLLPLIRPGALRMTRCLFRGHLCHTLLPQTTYEMRDKNHKGACLHCMDEETPRDGGDGTLYDRFAVAIFTYICQHVSNKQDAEDL